MQRSARLWIWPAHMRQVANMNILIGCEYSGTVRDAFLRRGHNAWSNDIIDTESKPERHLKMDITKALLSRRWDLAIIHIPCTAMALCGNGTYAGTVERENALLWSYDVWETAKECCTSVVFENPTSVLFPLLRKLGADVQYVHPWQHGHMEQKKTGLALWNQKRLVETNNVYEEMMKLPKKERERIWYMSPGKDRGKERARFYTGIAEAMAEQWGKGMRDQGETEANARLIAAAPDLLEALRELFATVQGECPRLLDEDRGANPHLYSSIVDAIAKAEGQ